MTPRSISRTSMTGNGTVANNPMCVEGTPVEHYPELGLWVKREDMCCPSGPHFSKTRGVYAHISQRPEKLIGVLDTSHSQGGWATAQACRLLGKNCMLYYPQTKKMREEQLPLMTQTRAALDLGAGITALQAGRSAVLYHSAKKHLALSEGLFEQPSYMMPNALKLPEMIDETVAEVLRTPLPPVKTVIISASSGTIAAGVISGLARLNYTGGIIVHQGYSRPEHTIRNYMGKMVSDYAWRLQEAGKHPMDNTQLWTEKFTLVDEGYSYGDKSRGTEVPPFPSNMFYDLKAFHWWMENRLDRKYAGEALLWNIG